MSWTLLGLLLFIFCQKGPLSGRTGERAIPSTVDYEEILISTWWPQFLCSTYLYLALPQAIILLAICPNFHTQTNDYCISTNYVINCPSSVVSNLWLCPPPTEYAGLFASLPQSHCFLGVPVLHNLVCMSCIEVFNQNLHKIPHLSLAWMYRKILNYSPFSPNIAL